MKNKTIALYFVILLSFSTLLSCSEMNEIDVLNQRVDELVNIIEDHKEREIKNYLTNDFSVVKRFNKAQFLLFIHYQLKQNKNISISVFDKNITLDKNFADVTANILLLGSNEWLPERGQIYKIASRWIKDGDDWKMRNLRWEISDKTSG